jgi:hypothetical protein
MPSRATSGEGKSKSRSSASPGGRAPPILPAPGPLALAATAAAPGEVSASPPGSAAATRPGSTSGSGALGGGALPEAAGAAEAAAAELDSAPAPPSGAPTGAAAASALLGGADAAAAAGGPPAAAPPAVGATPAVAPFGNFSAALVANITHLVNEAIARGFAERDAASRAERDARAADRARSEDEYSEDEYYDTDGSEESDVEEISMADLLLESRRHGHVPFDPENSHWLAQRYRHETNGRPRLRSTVGNESFDRCTDGGREAPGPIGKEIERAENRVYDEFNLRAFMLFLLGQLRQNREEDSDFYKMFAQCCNTMDELYRRANLERSILVARAGALGHQASAYKKELAKFIVSVTDAEDGAPANMEDTIQSLTDRFAADVNRAERTNLAKKAAYGDNGGGGGGGGGFGAARQEKNQLAPRHKNKSRGTRGGSDKREARGSPRGDRRDPDQREPRGRATRGNGGHESDDLRGGHAGRDQRREPRDARGKARGEQDRNGGGGRGGGGGGRGGGNDRHVHGESSSQGQRGRDARRGDKSDASSSDE